jgi:hypothetical protein
MNWPSQIIPIFIFIYCLIFVTYALVSSIVRHGYPWVPTDQAHGRPWQVGPAYQKTCWPVSGPNWPSWQPTRPLEDLPEDSPDDLIQHDLKTCIQDKTSVDFDQSRSTGYRKMCNIGLGLLVVIDQESGNWPHPLANIRRTRWPLVRSRNPQAIKIEELDVGFYSPDAQTSINSPRSLRSVYSCATFEFLALDSTPPTN